MEFYSAIKKSENFVICLPKQMELENFMLSGVIQVQKDKGCMFSLICGRQI
jgi:hypothetical protein